jgi:hypothetical protein
VDVAYYTHPAFFEPALCLVKALSRRARVHLLFEISAGAWQSAISVHDPDPHSGLHNWRKTVARRLAFRRADAFILHNKAARETFASPPPS